MFEFNTMLAIVKDFLEDLNEINIGIGKGKKIIKTSRAGQSGLKIKDEDRVTLGKWERTIYDLRDGTGEAECAIARRILDKEIDKYVAMRKWFEQELAVEEAAE